MDLLNFLRSTDKRVADLIKTDSEDNFPKDKFPDIRGLWSNASPAMREMLKQSLWKDFLPEISEGQAPEIGKQRYLDSILKTVRNLLKQFIEDIKLIEPFAGMREQKEKPHGASVAIEQLEQKELIERDPKKFWQFWDKMEETMARAIKGMRPERDLGLALTPEFRPEPEIGIEPEQDGTEFSDAYSALRAARKALENVHVRLLTRGEGKQEAGAVELIAETLRIIGCARELGADTDADEIEQKLNRILAKF